MSKSHDVHRPSEFERLKRAVADFNNGVTVIGVNGYGGVGKTYLLASVLEDIDLVSEKVLLLQTDGTNPKTRDDFAAIFEHQNSLAPQHLSEPARKDFDYFSHTHEVINCYRSTSFQLLGDIDKRAVSEGLDAEAIKSGIEKAIKLGVSVNQLVPKTKEWLDASSIGDKQQHLEQVIDFVAASSKALKSNLRGPFKHLSKQPLKDKVIHNFHSAVSESMITDLSAAISGYQTKDSLKPTKQRIPNTERLMIILDDFEVTKDVLAEFLIADFIPALQHAKFATLIVILGRDDLEASYPSFSRISRLIKDEIHLEPFSKEDAMLYLEEQQIKGAEAVRLYQDSHGYPFLLKLLVEGRNSNEASALFLQKFFERTTKWMTTYKKEWLLKLCL